MKTITKAAALAAFAAVCVGGAQAAPAADSWAGAWAGKGVDSRALGFDIRVVIHDDGSTAIEYASEPCSGTLLANGPWTGNVRRYRESIVKGGEVCIDGAELTLTVSKDGLMRYDWRGASEGQAITAIGMLRAEKAPGV